MKHVNVALELEKILPLYVKEGEAATLNAIVQMDKWLEKDKQMGDYLTTFDVETIEYTPIEKDLKFTLVKKALDAFDPYVVHPDSPDEYDGESKSIAKKINAQMSLDEIAEIIIDEFHHSFSEDFSKEEIAYPAETIFNLLNDSLNKPATLETEIGEEVYVYAKLFLAKTIPINVSGNEEAKTKAIQFVLDKIKAEKEAESFLASCSLSVGWGTKVIEDEKSKTGESIEKLDAQLDSLFTNSAD